MTTTEGDAVEEKALLNHVLDALTKPSTEHLSTYLGLGLALAIIAGLVFTALGSKNGQNQIKVTLDDVKTEPKAAAAKKDNTSKKESQKQVKKDEEKKAAVAKGEQDAEDWSDDDDEFDRDALFKDLDQRGPFVRTVQGTLEPHSMLKLRKIIIKHSALAFQERKDELFAERIGHLKNKKYKDYEASLNTIAEEFGKLLFDVTKTGAEFIEVDEATFEASVRELMKDPDCEAEFYEDEETVRLSVETEGKELLSRERTKELIIEKIKMEFESEKKLSDMKLESRRESERIAHLARQQVIDEIYIKHNIKYPDFSRAMKEYDFEDDEDIKATERLVLANRE